MSEFPDAALYLRGAETLVASWEAYAHGSAGAVVRRTPNVASAVFPIEPERGVYNNALLARDLAPTERAGALVAMAAAYESAGVARHAAWVYERDEAMRVDLERHGYAVDASTRAMGMALADMRLPRPEIDRRATPWSEYARLFGLPAGFLSGADHDVFHLVVACLGGEPVASALAFDHEGDCGIFNVTTLEHARRRGLGTALVAFQLHDARDRGCRTASLQSTPMAVNMYATAGFRDLGVIIEYVPSDPERDHGVLGI